VQCRSYTVPLYSFYSEKSKTPKVSPMGDTGIFLGVRSGAMMRILKLGKQGLSAPEIVYDDNMYAENYSAFGGDEDKRVDNWI
jgi:hypothetical protein